MQLFIDEASTALKPWVEAHAGECRSTLTRLDAQGNLEATTPSTLRGFFFAGVEFRTDALAGEITYGDRELLINTVVGPRGGALRYGLWEWADAVGRHDIPVRDTQWVVQPHRLRDIVRGMAEGLVTLAGVIGAGDPHVVERMDAARALVRSGERAHLRQAEHARAVRLAHEAFQGQHWARAVELLRSVHDLLTPAELARLRYAEARLR